MKQFNSLFKNEKCLILTLVLGLFFSGGISARAKDTLRVLFVGNSYTYFWNMPRMVSALAAGQGKTIIVKKSTAGGAYLREHWKGKKKLKTRDLITRGRWDIVVLQNQSLSAIEKYKDFMKYGKKFIHLIKQSGAVPMVYITWAREKNPASQEAITKAYTMLAKESGAKIAPVGPVWTRLRKDHPGLTLFFPDGSHPSNMGSYLISNVFYACITGGKTASLPAKVTIRDQDGEKLYLSMITKDDAALIHQAVDKYLFSSDRDNEDK